MPAGFVSAILMTSLATILGLLPLAFGFGPGAQMQHPLAIAVIGSLTVNMLVTRLFLPGWTIEPRTARKTCGHPVNRRTRVRQKGPTGAENWSERFVKSF